MEEGADFFSVDVEYFHAGLVRDASDPAASGADLSGLAFPPTRSTLEIARLAPRPTTRQQKLALELMKSMLGADDETDPVD